MTSAHLETWVKSMTSWQSRQFGSLSVQEDVNIVEREILAARGRLEAAQPVAPVSPPDASSEGPCGRSRRGEDSDASSCEEARSDRS